MILNCRLVSLFHIRRPFYYIFQESRKKIGTYERIMNNQAMQFWIFKLNLKPSSF